MFHHFAPSRDCSGSGGGSCAPDAAGRWSAGRCRLEGKWPPHCCCWCVRMFAQAPAATNAALHPAPASPPCTSLQGWHDKTQCRQFSPPPFVTYCSKSYHTPLFCRSTLMMGFLESLSRAASQDRLRGVGLSHLQRSESPSAQPSMAAASAMSMWRRAFAGDGPCPGDCPATNAAWPLSACTVGQTACHLKSLYSSSRKDLPSACASQSICC